MGARPLLLPSSPPSSVLNPKDPSLSPRYLPLSLKFFPVTGNRSPVRSRSLRLHSPRLLPRWLKQCFQGATPLILNLRFRHFASGSDSGDESRDVGGADKTSKPEIYLVRSFSPYLCRPGRSQLEPRMIQRKDGYL